MKVISFDIYRSIGIPDVINLKAGDFFKERELIKTADWVVFPESWQVDPLHYVLKMKIFPSVATYHLGFDKVRMTRALQMIVPEHLPHTLILPGDQRSIDIAIDQLSFPMIAKHPRSARGEGVFLIESKIDLRAYATTVETLYLQEFLQNDRDLRIVVIGTKILAAYWRIKPAGSLHANIAKGATVSSKEIPGDILDLILDLAKKLNIDHAGFDCLYNNGQWYILEFNPLFGCLGLNQLGIGTAPAIIEYLERVQ